MWKCNIINICLYSCFRYSYDITSNGREIEVVIWILEKSKVNHDDSWRKFNISNKTTTESSLYICLKTGSMMASSNEDCKKETQCMMVLQSVSSVKSWGCADPNMSSANSLDWQSINYHMCCMNSQVNKYTTSITKNQLIDVNIAFSPQIYVPYVFARFISSTWQLWLQRLVSLFKTPLHY